MFFLKNFLCETAHKFQGDERDLIVFSPVVSRDISQGAIGFLKSQGNIFNVGITKARGALVVVGDRQACASSEVAYLSAFVRYVAERNTEEPGLPKESFPNEPEVGFPTVAHPERVSDWEKILYAALLEAGIRTIPQYPIDQYELDLAFILPNGRKLDIEVDGEQYHRDWDDELTQRDQLRNLRFIEMDWDVLRFWVYEIRASLPACVDRVKAWIQTANARPGV